MVKHKKTNKPYLKLINTKIKINGEWLEAVIYMCLYWNKDSMFWVRLKQDFEENFE